MTMPNFPNFRLGPLKGSPCDTLGLSGAEEVLVDKGEGYRFYPNPISDVLTVEAPESVAQRSLEVLC